MTRPVAVVLVLGLVLPAALAPLGCRAGKVERQAAAAPALVVDFGVPQVWMDAASALTDRIAADLARQDLAAAMASFTGGAAEMDLVQRWLERTMISATRPIEVSYSAWYRCGDGFVADLFFTTRSREGQRGTQPETQTFLERIVYFPATGGIALALPAGTGAARLTAAQARLELTPDPGTLEADVELTVASASEQIIVFTHAVGDEGFDVVAVTQDGVRSHYRSDDGHLLVAPARPGPVVRLRVQYAGPVEATYLDHIRADDLILRGEAGWLPVIPGSRADFDVTVVHPGGYQLVGQGDEQPLADARPGWVSSRWHIAEEEYFTLYGAPAYRTRDLTMAGTRVRLLLWPRDADRLDPLADTVRQAFTALAPLGAYPYREVRVVESDFFDGSGGYGALSAIGLGWRLVREQQDPQFIAHELSHGWFGGTVPPDAAAIASGQWNETIAEYVGTWALSAADAARTRGGWMETYAQLADADDRPIAQVGSGTASLAVHQAVSYAKGALVLTALEDLIGRPALARALARFVRARTGKPSAWADVVAAVAAESGAEAGRWLGDWLTRRGAPDLRLTDAVVERGTLRATLAQTTTPPCSGVITVVFFAGDERLGAERITFSGAATPIALPVPAAATLLALDPDGRYPRRYHGTGHKARVGLVVNLK